MERHLCGITMPDPARVKVGQFAPKSVVLHVGCSQHASDELSFIFAPTLWTELRLDIDPAVKPDIVGSMTDMHMIDDGAVDAVYSNQNLEHVFAHEVQQTLREFHRVLSPRGVVVIGVPDLMQVAEQIVAGKLDATVYDSIAGPVAPIDMIYGYRPLIALGMNFMAHKTGFTATTLEDALATSGFSRITVTVEPWRLLAAAYKSA